MFWESLLCLLAAELNEWHPAALICSAGRRSNRRTKDEAEGQWRNTVGHMGEPMTTGRSGTTTADHRRARSKKEQASKHAAGKISDSTAATQQGKPTVVVGEFFQERNIYRNTHYTHFFCSFLFISSVPQSYSSSCSPSLSASSCSLATDHEESKYVSKVKQSVNLWKTLARRSAALFTLFSWKKKKKQEEKKTQGWPPLQRGYSISMSFFISHWWIIQGDLPTTEWERKRGRETKKRTGEVCRGSCLF